jgi:hypothetical protein
VLVQYYHSFLTCGSAVVASLAPQDVRRRLEETLRANASRPLFTGVAVSSFRALT